MPEKTKVSILIPVYNERNIELATGQLVDCSLPTAEVIRAAAALDPPAPEALPRDPLRLPGGAGNTSHGQGIRRGTGFAVGFKNICFSEGFDDFCAARVKLFCSNTATKAFVSPKPGAGIGALSLFVKTIKTICIIRSYRQPLQGPSSKRRNEMQPETAS